MAWRRTNRESASPRAPRPRAGGEPEPGTSAHGEDQPETEEDEQTSAQESGHGTQKSEDTRYFWTTEPAPGPDGDGDGVPDDFESKVGTDPHDSDSDDDGVNDGWEEDMGTDPLNPGDTPPGEDRDGIPNLEDCDWTIEEEGRRCF